MLFQESNTAYMFSRIADVQFITPLKMNIFFIFLRRILHVKNLGSFYQEWVQHFFLQGFIHEKLVWKNIAGCDLPSMKSEVTTRELFR